MKKTWNIRMNNFIGKNFWENAKVKLNLPNYEKKIL